MSKSRYNRNQRVRQPSELKQALGDSAVVCLMLLVVMLILAV